MSELAGKNILLGVTGGIAAYKSADLVRRLREAGASVQVVMTPAATAFITPLTLQAVSGQPVRTELFDVDAEAAMGHIELARWAEHVLVAPASAGFMARLAHGMADDLLTTLCLATGAPIALAPAMNRQMWANPATRDNAALLGQRGIRLLGPGEGDQACGEVGAGRMLEPTELVAALEQLQAGDGGVLSGLAVVVTAGPTREPLDPVRYISNRSSGKMGFAVAAAAAAAGAQVTLITGPVSLATPPGVVRIDVETAAEMQEAVHRVQAACDIFVAAAAVADYRSGAPEAQKIKKKADNFSLKLEKTDDILAAVAAGKQPPFTVGFAAETSDLLRHAGDKLRRKGLDMIAANLVDDAGRGFDSDDNALHVLWEDGEQALEQQPKTQLASALVELIGQRYAARRRDNGRQNN